MAEESTRDKIIRYRNEDPYITQSDLSRKCECSRQRIWQLLKEMGLPLNPRDAYIQEEITKIYRDNPNIVASKCAQVLNCSVKRAEKIIRELKKEG